MRKRFASSFRPPSRGPALSIAPVVGKQGSDLQLPQKSATNLVRLLLGCDTPVHGSASRSAEPRLQFDRVQFLRSRFQVVREPRPTKKWTPIRPNAIPLA
jgi:hypothetical protein